MALGTNENQVVFETNNPRFTCNMGDRKPAECPCGEGMVFEGPYGPDPVNIFNAMGKHVGYSWNYGDTVELDINIQNTVLAVRPDQVDELEMYLSDKEVEINFIDIRGEVDYTFSVPAALITKLKLNTDEKTLIPRNTYTCTAVLVNPKDLSRINLFRVPYKVYVK